MDNKSSDNFINNNVNYGQDKPTPNQYELKNINPEIPNNNINPNQNYDAPNPMNPQNVPQYPLMLLLKGFIILITPLIIPLILTLVIQTLLKHILIIQI